jgi:Holliday junction resolvase RusA-like endonuclease
MFPALARPADVRPSGRKLSVRVPGIPIPQGSMRGFVVGGRAVLTSDNPRLRSWRNDLAAALFAARSGPPMTGAVVLKVWFFLPRPASHYGRHGRLLPSAPARPIGARDDLDKLVRAIGDAATVAGVWRDDGQVVDCHSSKRWADSDAIANAEGGPGVLIKIAEFAG